MKSYKELIGLEISQAREKLGYWWICVHCQINYPFGFYIFEKAAGAHIELTTNEKNMVISEHHNFYAEQHLLNS